MSDRIATIYGLAGVLAYLGGLATYEIVVLTIAVTGLLVGTVAIVLSWRTYKSLEELQARQADRIDRLPSPED